MTSTREADATAWTAAAQRWRALFDDHAGAFAELVDGARMGFVARADFASIGGRRLAGLVQAGERASGAPMLAFVAAGGTMTIEHARFDGFEHAAIDLLFVADDAALDEWLRVERRDALGGIKRALRCGGVMFYALKPKHELQDLGYEGFLDSLGLAFLGACR